MKLKSLHLLLILALCWGPSFLFIKLALEELTPIMLSVFRIGLGALILNLILIAKRTYLPTDKAFWKDSAVAAFFSVAFPFLLINWGQQFIDSSLGALLNGTTPFFTVLFSYLLLKDEHISPNKFRGIAIGFVGLLVLVYPNLRAGVTASLLGIGAVVLASISYGMGWVYVRKRLTGIASFKAPAAQLLIGAFYLLPFALFTATDTPLSELTWVTAGSVLALGVLGTAVAFILYFRLIAQAGPSYAAMVTYLVPVIGVVLGVVVLQETITPWILIGAGLILLGIYIGGKRTTQACERKACVDAGAFSRVR